METKAQSYYSNTRQDMMAFVQGNPNKILEIGCGIGGFRKNFHNDVEYWGIEPYEAAAEQAKLMLTKTISGTYETAKRDIPDQYFDLVVCNDVIEHMTDPIEFLKDVRSKLANNGKMIVSVPNLRNAVTLYDLLIKGDFQYVSAGVLDYTHFHLFTKNSFCKMAIECGWEVEICRPLPPQPFKPIKNIVLNCITPFIPEIKSFQIAARLRPNTDVH